MLPESWASTGSKGSGLGCSEVSNTLSTLQVLLLLLLLLLLLHVGPLP
jgi:hypothetical protein